MWFRISLAVTLLAVCYGYTCTKCRRARGDEDHCNAQLGADANKTCGDKHVCTIDVRCDGQGRTMWIKGCERRKPDMELNTILCKENNTRCRYHCEGDLCNLYGPPDLAPSLHCTPALIDPTECDTDTESGDTSMTSYCDDGCGTVTVTTTRVTTTTKHRVTTEVDETTTVTKACDDACTADPSATTTTCPGGNDPDNSTTTTATTTPTPTTTTPPTTTTLTTTTSTPPVTGTPFTTTKSPDTCFECDSHEVVGDDMDHQCNDMGQKACSDYCRTTFTCIKGEGKRLIAKSCVPLSPLCDNVNGLPAIVRGRHNDSMSVMNECCMGYKCNRYAGKRLELLTGLFNDCGSVEP